MGSGKDADASLAAAAVTEDEWMDFMTAWQRKKEAEGGALAAVWDESVALLGWPTYARYVRAQMVYAGRPDLADRIELPPWPSSARPQGSGFQLPSVSIEHRLDDFGADADWRPGM